MAATPRQELTDTSEQLRLAVSTFQAVGDKVMSLAASMGGTCPLSEAAASVSKSARMAKTEAAKVLKAAEAAEAAATRATAVVTAAEKAKAAAAVQAKKAANVAAKAVAAAAEAAQAAKAAGAAAAALEVGNMYGCVASLSCCCYRPVLSGRCVSSAFAPTLKRLRGRLRKHGNAKLLCACVQNSPLYF